MTSLAGARIALLEARLETELGTLVRRYGGIPVCAPALRESPLTGAPEVATFVRLLIARSCPVVVVLTGVGVRRLFQEADRLGRLTALVTALGEVTIVARGPKPIAALAAAGLRPALTAREPYTTTELLQALEGVALEGRRVGVVHYGERNEPLLRALRARGAQIDEVQFYEWRLPDDLEPLRTLVRDIVAGRIAAVCFTTRVQLRHLVEVAEAMGLGPKLIAALATQTVTVSVGPSCTAALGALGITPEVEPSRPKMGAMMAALAAYWRRR